MLTTLSSISVATPPSLMNVCAESRQIFLSHYTRLILSPDYPSGVYVSFDSDTIFFDSLECSPQGDLAHDLACSPHSDRILSCAIDVQLWEVLRVFRFDSLSEVRLLENLRTVALVMRKGRGTGVDGIEFDGERALAASGLERREGLFYVENLRKTLEASVKRHWDRTSAGCHFEGGIPSVQLWFR